MLKLWKNKRNDLYIFLARRDVQKLTCLTAKFKKNLQNHFEKSPGEVMVYDEHSSFGAVKKCWSKDWVSMLYCRRYADFVSANLFSQNIMFTVT